MLSGGKKRCRTEKKKELSPNFDIIDIFQAKFMDGNEGKKSTVQKNDYFFWPTNKNINHTKKIVH